VQCRLNKSVADLYIDALSQLGIKFTIEVAEKFALRGTIEATQEVGANLLAKAGFKSSFQTEAEGVQKKQSVGHDINDLRHIADILKNSDRILVIEDFHYLSSEHRKNFSFDMKALWDYGVYVVVIGIWAENNLLIHLNPDLSGRIDELSINWTDDELRKVVMKGCAELNVQFDNKIISALVDNSFGTVGILQRLTLSTLDHYGIREKPYSMTIISNYDCFESAALEYAEQLIPSLTDQNPCAHSRIPIDIMVHG